MAKKLKKNSAKAWKKSEVAREYEAAMQKVRNEEIMSATNSESLFVVDTTGSEHLRKVVLDDKLDEATSKREDLLVKDIKKKLAKGQITQKKRSASSATNYDLWSAPVDKKFDSKQFLTKEDFEISRKEKKSPREVVVPNSYPAVPLPNPGTSYNPDQEQHQDALGETLAHELEYEERIENEKKLPGGLTKADIMKQTVDPNILASSLLFDEEDDDEEEELKPHEDDYEEPLFVGPTLNRHVSDASRRRRQENENERQKAMERKRMNLLYNQIDQSKKLSKEIEKEKEEKLKAIQKEAEVQKMLKEKAIPPILLGVLNYTKAAPKVDVLLTEEITGDLRRMKNIISPVKDRLEVIDRRNLVPMGGAKKKAKFDKLRQKKRGNRGFNI